MFGLTVEIEAELAHLDSTATLGEAASIIKITTQITSAVARMALHMATSCPDTHAVTLVQKGPALENYNDAFIALGVQTQEGSDQQYEEQSIIVTSLGAIPERVTVPFADDLLGPMANWIHQITTILLQKPHVQQTAASFLSRLFGRSGAKSSLTLNFNAAAWSAEIERIAAGHGVPAVPDLTADALRAGGVCSTPHCLEPVGSIGTNKRCFECNAEAQIAKSPALQQQRQKMLARTGRTAVAATSVQSEYNAEAQIAKSPAHQITKKIMMVRNDGNRVAAAAVQKEHLAALRIAVSPALQQLQKKMVARTGRTSVGAAAVQNELNAELRLRGEQALQQIRKIMMAQNGGKRVSAKSVQDEYNHKLKVQGLLDVESDIEFLELLEQKFKSLFEKFKKTGDAPAAAQAAVTAARKAQDAPGLPPPLHAKLVQSGLNDFHASLFLQTRQSQAQVGCKGSCVLRGCGLCRNVGQASGRFAKAKAKATDAP